MTYTIWDEYHDDHVRQAIEDESAEVTNSPDFHKYVRLKKQMHEIDLAAQACAEKGLPYDELSRQFNALDSEATPVFGRLYKAWKSCGYNYGANSLDGLHRAINQAVATA